MDEKNKIQENSSEENQVKKTDSKILSKFTPKIAVILGAALFVLILFIAIISVGGKDNNDDDGDYSDNSSQSGSGNYGNNEGATNNGGANNGNNSSNNNNNGGNSSNGSTSTNSLIIDDFVTGYSEGLAFVKEKYGSHKTNCIDKNGNIIFSVETISGSDNSGFHNGWAMLEEYNAESESYKYKYVLRDKKGNIKTAEELGGNSFIFNQEAFEDGYILVKKTTTNYQGSIDELAVFNAELEKIVDFSKELFVNYSNNRFYGYYKGILFTGDKFYNRDTDSYYNVYTYLNLQTGEFGVSGPEFFDNTTLDYESDMWTINAEWAEVGRSWDISVYNRLDDSKTPIIEFLNINAHMTDFKDGYAGLIYEVDDSEEGDISYFTIINENGEQCFEPIKNIGLLESGCTLSENGIFLVWTLDYSNGGISASGLSSIEVFDKTGRIGCIEFDKNEQHRYSGFEFSDGVICIQTTYYSSVSKEKEQWIGVYNTQLESLFDFEVHDLY